MEITFKIKETIDQIKSEIENPNPGRWEFFTVKDGLYRLYDENINDCSAGVVYSDNSNSVFIETALNAYKYAIQENKGETYVSYIGAYRGLLQQNLLPTLTPKDNLLDVKNVKGSGRTWETMRDYIGYKEEEWALKEKYRANNNKYCHPACISSIIKKTEEQSAPITNSEKTQPSFRRR